MRKAIKIILQVVLAVLISGLIYFYYQPLSEFAEPTMLRLDQLVRRQITELYPACSQSIKYSLGEIDPRFKLSTEEVGSIMMEASVIWSEPFGRTLFAYATSGALVINFVYDERQQTTDELRQLGLIVADDRKTYENLKSQYETLNNDYLDKRAELERRIAAYESQLDAFNDEVDKWNRRGGAPAIIYKQLKQTETELEAERRQINSFTAEVNKLGDEINVLIRKLNQLITGLNLNVGKYNEIGGPDGEPFEAGLYKESATGTSITVFEFSDRQELVRLLAHELGHALGLDHSSSSDDIMYYLNESKNATATAADLAALKLKCEAE